MAHETLETAEIPDCDCGQTASFYIRDTAKGRPAIYSCGRCLPKNIRQCKGTAMVRCVE